MQGRTRIAAALAAAALLACGPARAAAKRTQVEVSGRQLLVDGAPFHMKGVCWNPVPSGGTHPADLDFAGFAATDAELMAIAGINVVRTYEAINDTRVLDELWRHKIYVLNTVYVNGEYPVERALGSVEMVKDHPAILMWVVGNEWNYNGLYTGLPFEESRERVREAVQCIKDADPGHLVATVHGELPSSETLEALGNVDVWGINKYDGDSFGDLFQSWAGMSELPMFLGEYGADAYNSDEDKEDEQAQADATTRLTKEIVEASSVDKDGVCVGGVIFELADEWWKDDSGNPDEHDIGGISPGGGPYPDRTFNEEWWGLLHHDGTARKAFKAYASIKVPGGADPDLAGVDGAVHASPPPREKACGAHRACRGHAGDCCPARNRSMAACCDATSARLPPEDKEQVAADDAPAKKGGRTSTLPETATSTSTLTSTSRRPMGSAAEALDDAEAEEAEEQSEDTPAPAVEGPPAPASASEDGAHDGGRYRFVGWETPSEARRACRKVGRLAMPKSDQQKKGVLQAIQRAIAAGDMEDSWPRNAVWLAGRWNTSSEKWEWDDSTDIPELAGQKAAKLDSAGKPWLCVSADGQARAWDGGKLGVLCELGGTEGKPRARELALQPRSDVAWVRAPPATDCDEACAGAGMSCAEGQWPGTADEFERVVLPGAGSPPCATIQSGGHRYDPSASGRHCGWQGPDDRPAWLGRRCGAPAPRGSRRFCPCQGAAAADLPAERPIWA